MANNRIPSGPNTPGSQHTPTQQGIRVFIQRDYSDGTAVKFQTRFPEELEDRIDPQAYDYTIRKLNEHFEMAETADCSTYCEGCLACLTAYFIYICTETHYEKEPSRQSGSRPRLPSDPLCSFDPYTLCIDAAVMQYLHLRKVSKFIATQNERVYNPRGVHITDPILRGLRVIEITIIDLPNCQSPTGNSTNTIRHA